MRIVEFETEDGATLLVQVPTDGAGAVVTRGLDAPAVLDRAQQTFEAALQPIRRVSAGVLAELRAIPRPPDEVSVEFGLEFTANSSAVLVGAEATASVRVQLTWRSAEPAPVAGRNAP